MEYVKLALNWIFGLLLIVSGLVFMMQSPLAGLCLIVMSLFLLPPIRNAVFAKTKKEFPLKARVVSLLVLFIAFNLFMNQSRNEKAAELEAQKAEEQAQKLAKDRQDNIDYFNSNRETILSSASAALSEENFEVVVSQTGKYLAANDPELNEIHGKAKRALDEINRAAREAKEKAQREAMTNELVVKLKTVPSSEFEENKNLYQQLVNLNPNNTEYQQKLDYYSQKLNEKIEKENEEREKRKIENLARIAVFGEQPTQKVNGSYYAVESYLKKVANDPDSIKVDGCTNVYHTKEGWLVGCDYRGKNAFGGVVRNSNWFTILHNQVVQMHDADAYKP